MAEKEDIVPFVRKRFENMFENMLKEMNEFDRIFGLRHHIPVLERFSGFPEVEEFETLEPAVDIVDKGDKFEVTADVPGIPKENLDVNVTDNEIEIKGNFEEEKKEEKKNYIKRERRAKSVYRCVSLPEEIIPDEASAKMENGILKISLPKKKPTEEPKAKKIKIE